MEKWTSGQYEFTLINGMTGDPGLHVFFNQTGDAVLFDLGSLEQLANKQLTKVRTVCVSHTHIDHFIGFDRLLRVNIQSFQELEFCGPVGLAANIQGKLKGYIWNLLVDDQLRFRVHEIDRQGVVQSFYMTNTDGFVLTPCPSPEPIKSSLHARPLPEKPVSFVTNLSDGSRIEAVVLDHGTDSVAFLNQAPLRFSVKVDEIPKLGLTPGAWIKELQNAVAEARFDESISINGKAYRVRDLSASILSCEAPRVLGYVTDICFSDYNLERLALLMSDVELLVCEANFRECDRAEAVKKKHLTTLDVARISKRIRADQTKIFHMSRIYKGDVEGHISEFKSHLI